MSMQEEQLQFEDEEEYIQEQQFPDKKKRTWTETGSEFLESIETSTEKAAEKIIGEENLKKAGDYLYEKAGEVKETFNNVKESVNDTWEGTKKKVSDFSASSSSASSSDEEKENKDNEDKMDTRISEGMQTAIAEESSKITHNAGEKVLEERERRGEEDYIGAKPSPSPPKEPGVFIGTLQAGKEKLLNAVNLISSVFYGEETEENVNKNNKNLNKNININEDEKGNREIIKEKVEDFKENINDKSEKAKENIDKKMEQGKQMAKETKDKVSQKAQDTWNSATEKYEELKDKGNQYFKEESEPQKVERSTEHN